MIILIALSINDLIITLVTMPRPYGSGKI